MKLSALENYNISKTQNYNKNSVNFKQLPVPPILKTQVVKESTPEAKKVFTKLAQILGLGAIINWTNQFKSSNNTEAELKEIRQALDDIETQGEIEAEDYLLNPETIGTYLEVSSKADEIASIIETKGIVTGTKLDIVSTEDMEESKKLLLDNEKRDAYIENRKQIALNNLIKQTSTIAKTPDEQREKILATLDKKIEELAKQANQLRTEEQTSEIYAKLSSIINTQAILTEIKLRTLSSTDKEKDILVEEPILELVEEPIEIQESVVTKDIAEETTETPITNNTEIVEEITIEETESDKTNSDIPKLAGPKILGKIDLEPVKTVKAKKKTDKATIIPTKEIVTTKQNMHIVSRLRETFAKEKGTVPPEAYTDKLDFIKEIYNTYKKPNVKRIFMNNLVHDYQLKMLENFEKLTSGNLENAKIGYINYVDLEKIKNSEQGTITQEEFDKLCEYQNTIYKYINGMPKDKRIDVSFKTGSISCEEMLKYIVELHKIVFNVVDTNRVENPNPNGPFEDYEITNEIVDRICKKPDDYKNICEYLGIDTFEIENKLRNSDPDYEEIREIADELLNDKETQARILKLGKLLENKSFNDLFVGIHSRMRMLERFVLPSAKGNLSDANIHTKINQEVNYLKRELLAPDVISIYNYVDNKGSRKAENICSPKVVLNDTIIALDDNGKIHTLFANVK